MSGVIIVETAAPQNGLIGKYAMVGKGFIGILLLLGAGVPVWAADVELSDAAFQQCLSDLMQEQGWTSVDEVTEIECHNQEIKSLDGIEQFTALEKLSLYNNAIASVQLSAMPRLRHLNLSLNRLSSAVFMDLPNLQELYLFRNNIMELSLENFPALTILRANSNRLQSFQYQNLPALEKIYLFDNELETIDIHNLPRMQYMDVRENPMPDKLYEDMDAMTQSTILHDGNADDW